MHPSIPYMFFLFFYTILYQILKWSFKKIFKNQNKLLIVNFCLQLLSCFIYFVGILTILTCFSPMKDFLRMIMTGSGLVVVVLAFISQEAISNTINGILLMFSNSFAINDIITIPDKNLTGKVKSITLHHTEIINFENNTIIIPNKLMNNAIVENRRTNKYVCNFLYFDVAYGTNIDNVEKIVKNLVRNHIYYVDNRTEEDKRNNKDDIGFVVYELTSNGIKIRVSIWSLAENGFYMLSDIRKSLLISFNQEKIHIPFPQLEVHSNTKESYQ